MNLTLKPPKVALLAALLAAAFAAHADPSFSDGAMSVANYTQVLASPDPSVTIAISTLASGGNPGAALDIQFSNSGGAVSMNSFQGFVSKTFSYDPSAQGALASLGFSNDRFVSAGPELAGLNTVTRALLVQNGHYYVATLADVQLRDTWFTTSATGLTSSLFNGFDFATGTTDASAHPDFTSTGSTLSFGFVNRLLFDTAGQPVTLHADFRFDNVGFTLQAAPVPEPGTWALMGLALPLLGFATRRRLNAAG